MSAGWVAGSVRARALARRRLGTAAARALAGRPSLEEAVDVLVRSPYGHDVRPGDGLAEAQRAVAATLLWHLRVLAGWLPAAGAELLRLFAGWFEIANVDEHVRALQGQPAEPPYRLGALATTWPALAATGSRPALRAALACSVWGDPGGESPRELQLGPRMRWAQRLAARVEPAPLGGWRRRAGGGPGGDRGTAAAPAARCGRRRIPARPGGSDGRVAVDLSGVPIPPPLGRCRGRALLEELWLAEARWWVGCAPTHAAVAGSGFGPDRIVGAVAAARRRCLAGSGCAEWRLAAGRHWRCSMRGVRQWPRRR